jgi:hypothetical protein
MTNPRPKFCVGEEVMVRSTTWPELNTDSVEVVFAEYQISRSLRTGIIRMTWCYKTANGPNYDTEYFSDAALRKLPPEQRTQWSDCAWQPKKVAG